MEEYIYNQINLKEKMAVLIARQAMGRFAVAQEIDVTLLKDEKINREEA